MNFIKKHRASLAAGAIGGLMNGLLGAGGGIVITFYLRRALGGGERNDVFANALATMLPMSLVSLGYYLIGGYVRVDVSVLQMLPSAILGGGIGAFLLGRVKFRLLSVVFSLLVILSGLFMLLGA